MQIRRNMTLGCLRAENKRITLATMMKIGRSHMEGTATEPRWGAAETFWPTPCLHDSPGNGYHTAASMVAHLRADGPPSLRQVYWASFSNPCSNVFKPFYLHGPRPPASYAKGSSTWSGDSPWWTANRVKLLCDLNYPALAPLCRSTFDATERWEFERQAATEAEARRLIEAGREGGVAPLLQGFIDENCARIAKEYGSLDQLLPATLREAGIRYLFLDYMRGWISKSGVPLPLQGAS